jgi:hypothetical protein
LQSQESGYVNIAAPFEPNRCHRPCQLITPRVTRPEWATAKPPLASPLAKKKLYARTKNGTKSHKKVLHISDGIQDCRDAHIFDSCSSFLCLVFFKLSSHGGTANNVAPHGQQMF